MFARTDSSSPALLRKKTMKPSGTLFNANDKLDGGKTEA